MNGDYFYSERLMSVLRTEYIFLLWIFPIPPAKKTPAHSDNDCCFH